jgi:DNA repair exonuclease SbcCD ATPase subunit
VIHFREVCWMNFLSTGNQMTNIQLDRHRSTLIVGNNGAGKSTILDALSFVLYNKPFRNINKPQLINSINNKNCLVEVKFNVGGSEYHVKRGMRPHIFEIYKDDVLLNQDASSRDYQEFLEKQVLKLNHRAFCQVVVLGSATYVPFMQLKAFARREVIDDLLDIQVFTTMNSLLKDRVQKNKDAQQATKYEIDLVRERISMQEALIETLNRDTVALIADREKKISDLKNAIESGMNDAAGAMEEMTQLTASISDAADVSAYINKLQSMREKVLDKISALEKEVLFYHNNDTCPSCKQGIDHDFRDTTIDEKKLEIEKIKSGIPLLESKYAEQQERSVEIGNVQRTINTVNSRIASIKAQVLSEKKHQTALEKELVELRKTQEQNNDATKLFELQDELVRQEGTRERLVRESSVQAIASSILKDSGIKANVIKKYVPIMNKLINKYLAAMDFFVHFELDEQFNEVIKSRFRDEFSYQSFSEGEKLRINLAILFTWRAVAKLRNSASTNLLIMDEVLDGAMDHAGTEEFLKIIEELTKDTNLFIISHRGDQLFDKFHSVIKFEKHGDFSVMAKAA